MKNFITKYPIIIGLFLSVINGTLLLLLPFTGLSKSMYWGYKEAGLAMIIYYGGAVFISFVLCVSIQMIYKIKKIKNGFLFGILCFVNLLELFVLLSYLFACKEITNLFLFIIMTLIVSILKLITIIIYHLLYPKDKDGDTIQYWNDLWKCLFLSIVITCVILFLTIMILLFNIQ